MAVKTVGMVRKIRDKNFEKTKRFSIEKQVHSVKRKAEESAKKNENGTVSHHGYQGI
jgi:hypothetical protein